MKVLLDGTSIVVLGGWNPQVFSPKWIQNNLCDNKECQIEIEIPANNLAGQPRLSFESIYMTVNHSRIELRPKNPEDSCLDKCLNLLKKTLSILSHTPIVSYGVNFSFVTDGDHDNFIDKFIFNDNASFDADSYKLNKLNIQRSFRQNDGSLMNLSILTEKKSNVTVNFNYHHDVDNATSCIETLTEGLFSRYEQESREILHKVYDVQVNAE